jgi:hypothetical protein
MDQFSGEQAFKIIAPSHRVPWSRVLEEWFESFEQIDAESIIDVCLQHMTEYKHQRVIRTRIDQARWFCLPVYPYMDDLVFAAYYSLPLDHLKGDRAHLALLSDYKLGLEKVRAAAFHLVPMDKEYRYRHIIHRGRALRDRLYKPLRAKWQEAKGLAGIGRSILSPGWKPDELQNLRDCDLFDRSEVRDYLERAKSGRFANRRAMVCLMRALVIDDFLFQDKLPAERMPQYMKSQRNLRLKYEA